MQHNIFCVREFIKSESATAVQRAFRLRFNIQPPTRKSICLWNYQFEQIGCLCKGKSVFFNHAVYQTRCNITQFILSGNCSTCFWWYYHPSSRAQTTVSTACGICHTVIAIWRYRGRVGTGLSVLWVAYATHSTLKPVPTLLR